MFRLTSWVPRAARWMLLEISLVALFCSVTPPAAASDTWLISLMRPETRWIAVTTLPLTFWIRVDGIGDLAGRLGGLVGQALDLVGNHREALAGIAGARRLDGGVQRQKVGLLGDVGDQRGHPLDLLARLFQFADQLGRAIGVIHRLVGQFRGIVYLPGPSPRSRR